MKPMDSPRQQRRMLLAVGIGTTLEWFDFTLFAIFSLYIAKAFFPAQDQLMSLLATFVTLAVGFVARPLGAFLIGRYADRHGRKKALILTMNMMAASTVLIALCPGYSMLGYGATVLLVVARIVQGLAAGGEIGSALAYLCEAAPVSRRGFFTAFQQVAQAGSFLLCGLFASILATLLTPEQLGSWGWRIPFALGVLIYFVGVYVRRTLDESHAFQAHARQGVEVPAREILRHWRSLALGIGFVALWTVCTQLINFMPAYAQAMLNLDAGKAYYGITLVGFITLLSPLGGWLSDRWGRYNVMLLGALGMLLLAYPAFLALKHNPQDSGLMLLQAGLAMLMVLYAGPASAALAELFPVAVRSTGISVAYASSVVLFGSFTPTLVTVLYRYTGDPMMAAYYLLAAALVSFFALMIAYQSQLSAARQRMAGSRLELGE
ncbi:MFS transporter [Pseudomonas sessilinigenes]|uniref:MFS transporter n=1 Tax=Pseudomonas sessilinigenes TaxID=658629 RepID=A0ABX8MJC2_9PSED|nr:MFS transporter [Pseudomonas sessilinigenes]AZC26577.1 L-Proline/Glycine betaine transporter ProP [Pseudomonas sessilinigenes]QXH39424.1 MFS transporter [Pseudomonas sessilinigenes]